MSILGSPYFGKLLNELERGNLLRVWALKLQGSGFGLCWMVAEGGEGQNEKPSSLQNAGGGGAGFVSLQVPTSEAAVSADTHAFARLPPGGLRKNRNLKRFLWGKGPRPLVGRAPSPGGPGPKPPGDLAHRPLGPGSRHSHRLTSNQVFNFLLRLKQNATITPSPLFLGGLGWFPKAELYSSMRGGVPSSHFSRWAGPQA